MRTATIGIAILVLAGCTGEATRTSANGEVSAGAAGEGATAQLAALDTVLGQAYLDHPLVDATVALTDGQGQPISPDGGVYDTRSDVDGFFTVDPQRLPTDFTIVVTDGRHGDAVFDGALRRQVVGFNGWESLGVNAFTTLVAARHEDRPDESLADAEGAVRQFLGLGEGYRTEGLEVGTDDTYFSAEAFSEADEATPGGFDEFVDGVADDIEPGTTHSFAAPPDNQIEAVSAAVTLLISAAQITAIANCSASQPNFNLDTFSGCVMGTATDPAVIQGLDRINTRLQEVSNSVNDLGQLQAQTMHQIGQNNWSQLIRDLDNRYFQPVRNAWDQLTCATFPAYAETTRQRCLQSANDVADHIDRAGLAGALADDLTGAQAGRVPMVRSMGDFARLASGRFFRNPNQVSSAGNAPAALQSNWQYIDVNQMLLVWLLINFHNAKPNPDAAFIQQSIVAPYLGVPALNPDVTPPAPYGAGERSAPDCPRVNVTLGSCRGSRERALRLLPRELPEGTVIDTATGLMWLQNIGSRNGEGQAPTSGGRARTLSGYNRDAGTGQARDQQRQPDCDQQTWAQRNGADCPSVWRVSNMAPDVSAGQTGWRTPTQAELERLVRRGVDGPPTGTDLPDWLSGAAGFHWVFGPVDRTRSDLSQRPVRTIGTEVCLNSTAGVTDPRFTDQITRVCSSPETRAYTSTSNGQQVACGEGTRCVSGPQNHAVDLISGQTTFGELFRSDANGLWALAVRPLGPCEFYYDNTSGPSPADRAGC